jgi:hypothetical protein
MSRPAGRVRSPIRCRVLEILTAQPGPRFYTGNNLDGSARGRGGLYRHSAGFAFEPQGFPNAPNEPKFPSTILRPARPVASRSFIASRAAKPNQRLKYYGCGQPGQPRHVALSVAPSAVMIRRIYVEDMLGDRRHTPGAARIVCNTADAELL